MDYKKEQEMLSEVIETEIGKLNSMDDDLKAEAINNIQKLYEIRGYNKRNKEIKGIDIIRIGVELTGIILPFALYMVYLDRGFKFEEQGVYSSKTFGNLINRLKPVK